MELISWNSLTATNRFSLSGVVQRSQMGSERCRAWAGLNFRGHYPRNRPVQTPHERGMCCISAKREALFHVAIVSLGRVFSVNSSFLILARSSGLGSTRSLYIITVHVCGSAESMARPRRCSKSVDTNSSCALPLYVNAWREQTQQMRPCAGRRDHSCRFRSGSRGDRRPGERVRHESTSVLNYSLCSKML